MIFEKPFLAIKNLSAGAFKKAFLNNQLALTIKNVHTLGV